MGRDHGKTSSVLKETEIGRKMDFYLIFIVKIFLCVL